MFIPIVPTVPHTTVINKTIVYSDTVLPLNDSGINLKICSISNISEYSLESCLKKIFAANPDVIFNTIQYSKNNKKLYFYTDKTISTEAWEESQIKKYEPLKNSKEILEEVAKLLIKEKNTDTHCISIYDIANLIKKYNNDYKNIKKEYCECFQNILNEKYYNSSIIIYDLNDKKKELEIGFKSWNNYDKIVFSKQNEDLFVVESESIYSQEILKLIGKHLQELYNKLIKFSDFKSQTVYGIESQNSNFLIDISKYGVDIYNNSRFSKNFILSSHSYKDEYDFECNSTSVLTTLQGQEDEIFKRIFVNIDDCPLWSQKTLYQIRQEQKLNTEMKKQKKLELKRKLFPWINK